MYKKFQFKTLEQATREFQERNFDKRYIGATISKFGCPPREAEKILDYMENPKGMLVVLGIPGTGKTYLCSALVEWGLKNFASMRYHNEKKLLEHLRLGISEGQGDYARNLEHMIDDDFVMLDDVGSGINPEKVTYRDLEWRREIFFHFLDTRYNSMKPTLITSNFNEENFKDVYSERICSRLFSKENLIVKLFEGVEDKRQNGM